MTLIVYTNHLKCISRGQNFVLNHKVYVQLPIAHYHLISTQMSTIKFILSIVCILEFFVPVNGTTIYLAANFNFLSCLNQTRHHCHIPIFSSLLAQYILVYTVLFQRVTVYPSGINYHFHKKRFSQPYRIH